MTNINRELWERIADTLDKMAATLDRIELVLEEKQNRTLESKELRELMSNITKHYKNSDPPTDIIIGTRLHIFKFRDTIAKLKNFQNTKYENRRINKVMKDLEEHEFIYKHNTDIVEILDNGLDWAEQAKQCEQTPSIGFS